MTIQSMLDEGRLIRREWSGHDDDGRQLLCLYTALMNDPDARPETCPATVCPRWLAFLLPWINDVGTAEHWPEVVRRVARLAPRLAALGPEVEWRVRARIIAAKAAAAATEATATAAATTVAAYTAAKAATADRIIDAILDVVAEAP